MKRGGRIFVLLGLILALVAGGGVYYILAMANPGQEPPKTVKVVMAAQPIVQRSEIMPDQLIAADWPESIATPVGAVAEPTQVTGKLALVPVSPGIPIVDTMVISRGALTETHGNAAMILEKGWVAIAMGVGGTSNVANAIQTGDRVDILATFTAQPVGKAGENTGAPLTATQRLLADILILQVGPWSGECGKAECSASIVTFQLKEQDALVLKHAVDNGGNLTLVLRAANDTQLDNLEPVTLEYINKRFGFKFPVAGQ